MLADDIVQWAGWRLNLYLWELFMVDDISAQSLLCCCQFCLAESVV